MEFNSTMYCKSCGKKNPVGSKFCQHCGLEIEDVVKNENIHHSEQDTSEKYIDQDTSPYPYVVSLWKLVIMSIATFGFYYSYWFYKQWKSFNKDNWGKSRIILNSIFSPLSAYSLFKLISSELEKDNKRMKLESGALALLYFILSNMFLGFIPLLSVQKKINLHWEDKFGDRLIRSKFGLWNWIVIILIAMTFFLAVYSEDTTTSSTVPVQIEPTNTLTSENYTQEEIASSVVNIFCPSILGEEEGSGGSGTIITDDGVILTNSHIIPQDNDQVNVDDQGCLVILPNENTGRPEEMYWATPIVLKDISDSYDLAYLHIKEAYYDNDSHEYRGTYPRKFPAYDNEGRCVSENAKLGEKVTVFGYPSLSGGYSLTITEGVVSSLPGDGLIVTSAKISEGNSGGLAVNEDGCMIGIPSMISYDESESYGVIISSNLVNEFSNEVLELIEP